MSTQETATTLFVQAANGVKYAYRRIGITEGIPLVMQMHYRANMDFWDPALINALAETRPVIMFDQPGVGRSAGQAATKFQEWGDNAIALIEALKLQKIDLFGFSMGGCCVQMAALTAPHLIRKLIIGGSTASAPAGQVEGIVWPRTTPPDRPITLLSSAVTTAEIEEAIAVSFFDPTPEGLKAAKEYFARIYQRTKESSGEDPMFTLMRKEKLNSQLASYKDWVTYNPRNSFDRLHELKMSVLVQNGDDDLLLPTSLSWELAHLIPNAQLIIYPNSGHGYLWQYAERVAKDICQFLDRDDFEAAKSKL